jgi:hypothetical protein
VHDIWFEEDLEPGTATIDRIVKAGPGASSDAADEAEIRGSASGVVRVHRPRWGSWQPQQGVLDSGQGSRYVLVRLGFEFELTAAARERNGRFVFARCFGELAAAVDDEPAPSVYEMMPNDLYEGGRRQVRVNLAPSLSLGPLKASLGEVGSDHTVGTVEPAVVAWAGDDERFPRWELTPKSKSLVGVRHLWLAIELPPGCTASRLTVGAEADVQTKRFNVIPTAAVTTRRARPSVVVGAD